MSGVAGAWHLQSKKAAPDTTGEIWCLRLSVRIHRRAIYRLTLGGFKLAMNARTTAIPPEDNNHTSCLRVQNVPNSSGTPLCFTWTPSLLLASLNASTAARGSANFIETCAPWRSRRTPEPKCPWRLLSPERALLGVGAAAGQNLTGRLFWRIRIELYFEDAIGVRDTFRAAGLAPSSTSAKRFSASALPQTRACSNNVLDLEQDAHQA